VCVCVCVCVCVRAGNITSPPPASRFMVSTGLDCVYFLCSALQLWRVSIEKYPLKLLLLFNLDVIVPF
jgi:hypothetical protein